MSVTVSFVCLYILICKTLRDDPDVRSVPPSKNKPMPWNDGAMERRCHGTTVPWNDGAMERRCGIWRHSKGLVCNPLHFFNIEYANCLEDRTGNAKSCTE